MALPEKSAAANQPRKVYPALVVVNVVGIDSAVLVVTAVTAVPESVSYTHLTLPTNREV